MSTQELSPEQEEQLVGEMLRKCGRGGIDPDRLGTVVDLAALGLVNSAWRNTCVEDWHAEGRVHDGDMMRINSHMTWRVRRILHRWMTETGLAADGPLLALDGVPAEDVEWLAVRVFRWLVNPGRKLVTGATLAELAGADLAVYENDADVRLGGFAKQAADRGARFGFSWAAAHGALACPHWWGHPRWPDLVDRLLRALNDPADDHWGRDGEFRRRLPPEPPIVADRRLLRQVLRSHPWDLSSESTAWLVSAGIGYARSYGTLTDDAGLGQDVTAAMASVLHPARRRRTG
jgi:hypothetical protein